MKNNNSGINIISSCLVSWNDRALPGCSQLQKNSLKCKQRHHIHGESFGKASTDKVPWTNIQFNWFVLTSMTNILLLCWYCARKIQFTYTPMHISCSFPCLHKSLEFKRILDAIMRQLDLSEKWLFWNFQASERFKLVQSNFQRLKLKLLWFDFLANAFSMSSR